MSPQRIQLRRTAGWRKPDNTIVVARPSKWGNPWRVLPIDGGRSWQVRHAEWDDKGGRIAGDFDERVGRIRGTGATYWAVQHYRLHLGESGLIDHVGELRGHNLACWCPIGQPCHADVLLELANR